MLHARFKMMALQILDDNDALTSINVTSLNHVGYRLNVTNNDIPICNQEIVDIANPDLFKANYKLLSILSMTNQTGQSIVQVIPCDRHPGKSVEYFCK